MSGNKDSPFLPREDPPAGGKEKRAGERTVLGGTGEQ